MLLVTVTLAAPEMLPVHGSSTALQLTWEDSLGQAVKPHALHSTVQAAESARTHTPTQRRWEPWRQLVHQSSGWYDSFGVRLTDGSCAWLP